MFVNTCLKTNTNLTLTLAPPPQLHRRLLYDDVRGVAEPLNETSEIFPEGLVVRGRLLLLLDRPSVAADAHRPLAQEVVLQPLLTFMKGELSPGTRLEVSLEKKNRKKSLFLYLNHSFILFMFLPLVKLCLVLRSSGCTAPCCPPPDTDTVGC